MADVFELISKLEACLLKRKREPPEDPYAYVTAPKKPRPPRIAARRPSLNGRENNSPKPRTALLL